MGQGGSKEFEEVFQSTVSQLSEVQLAEIGTRFNELYRQAGGQRGRVIDREGFSNYFHLPITLGDRLFEAFDKKKNGSIDFEEFVCGLSVVLHGSFSSKCQLLFDLFNIAGDEGISREELYSLLSSVVHSTSTILLTVTEGGVAREGGARVSPITDTDDAIKNIVDAAFENCDISRSGKLLPLEFEYWLKRNPQMLDYLLPSAGKMGGETDDHHGNTLATLLAIDDDDKELKINETVPTEATPLESLMSLTENEQEVNNEISDGPSGQVEPPPTPIEDTPSRDTPIEDTSTSSHEVSPVPLQEERNEESEETNTVEENKVLIDNDKEQQKEVEEIQDNEEKEAMSTVVPSQDENEMENITEVIIDEEKQGVNKSENTDKERTHSFVSASEETLKLARQLSKDLEDVLTSPSSSEDFNLPTQFEEQKPSNSITQQINEDILSSWLPGEWVQSVLASGKKVSPEHLTKPGLIATTGPSDPIGEVLKGTFPGSERKVQLSADQVTMNQDGLITLIRNGYHHAALNLTSLFLSGHGQGMGQAGSMTTHTHKTLQMWSVRLALLCHLSRFSDAEKEFEAFHDLEQPDLYYQYNKQNYPETTGSMVPFSMRLLYAQLPLYTGNPQTALNRMCLLQHKTLTILNHIKKNQRLPMATSLLSEQDRSIAEEVWLKRLVHVKCLMANCLLTMKDYHLVQKLLTEVGELLPEQREIVYNCQGKLCLLYGNVSGAERYFSQANDSSSLTNSQKGLINVYQNQWTKAENDFKLAANDSSAYLPPIISLYNSAMCGLYQGHLHKTITHIEDIIKETPSSLQVSLFKVLFSLYQLESSQSQAKKLSWLPLLGYHASEGFSLISVGMIT